MCLVEAQGESRIMRTLLAFICFSGVALFGADQKLGIFDSNTDLGETPKKGSTEFDAAKGEYRITGGGANIWKDVDAFQFAWKKMSGDMAVTADVHFVGAGMAQHRKAAVMIRQSLDSGSAYADAA